MLNLEIRNNLVAILRNNGMAIAKDAGALNQALRSEAAQYPREIGMIVNAARAGIPAQIEAAGNAIYDMRPRLIEQLMNEFAFPADVAEWAVETWISAMAVAATAPAAAPAMPMPELQTAPPAPVYAAPAPSYAPAQPTYPQYNQFAYNGNRGAKIAAVVAGVILIAGMSVGAMFIFRSGSNPKPNPGPPPTPAPFVNPNPGPTPNPNPGPNPNPQPNPNPLPNPNPQPNPGPQPDPTPEPDPNPQPNPGPMDQSAVGSYSLDFYIKDVHVPGATEQQIAQSLANTQSHLELQADGSFSFTFSDNSGSVEAHGKWSGGPQGLTLTCESLSGNGQQADPSKFQMTLTPQEPGKYAIQGSLPDLLNRTLPGLKLTWDKRN